MRKLLENIYREHRQALFSLALTITHQRELAEDAIHDAIVRLCRSGRQPTGDPVAYVFASVRNAALDQMRRKRFVHSSIDSIFESAGSFDSPSQDIEEDEQSAMLRSALEKLPDAQRETIVMKLYGNLTFDQIAQASNEPLSTVSSRYRRGIAALKESMEALV